MFFVTDALSCSSWTFQGKISWLDVVKIPNSFDIVGSEALGPINTNTSQTFVDRGCGFYG